VKVGYLRVLSKCNYSIILEFSDGLQANKERVMLTEKELATL